MSTGGDEYWWCARCDHYVGEKRRRFGGACPSGGRLCADADPGPCGSPVGLGGSVRQTLRQTGRARGQRPSGPTAVRQVLRQASQALRWPSSGLCGAATGWRAVPVEPVEPVVGSLSSLSSLGPWARQTPWVRLGHIVRGEEAADDRCRRAASGDPHVGVGHSSASPSLIAINYENVIRCESVRACSGHPRHDQPGPSWPRTIASCHAVSGADPGQRRSPQRADADSTANDGRPDSVYAVGLAATCPARVCDVTRVGTGRLAKQPPVPPCGLMRHMYWVARPGGWGRSRGWHGGGMRRGALREAEKKPWRKPWGSPGEALKAVPEETLKEAAKQTL